MPAKKIVRQVQAKAKKPSTYSALAGLAAGLAPLFPQYAAALSAASLVMATVGTFMPAKASEVVNAP